MRLEAGAATHDEPGAEAWASLAVLTQVRNGPCFKDPLKKTCSVPCFPLCSSKMLLWHVGHMPMLPLSAQLVLLGLSLVLGQMLEKRRVQWLSEAGVALLLGVSMGVLSRVFSISKTYMDWLSFSVRRPC